MKVSHILKEKTGATIESIAANATIGEAIGRLGALRIGCLMVSDGKTEIAGIISERDIVRGISQKGEAALSSPVSDLMTANVKTIEPSATAQSALEMMSEGRFRHLPVTENGALVGLISIGDVVSARLREIERENSALNDMISGAAF